MRDLLLVGFLFVAIFYAFKRPYLGLAAWVWIALAAPTNWAFGFSQSFRLNFTIVIFTALSYLFVMKNKSFRPGKIGFWVLAFGFWTMVSTAFTLQSDPGWVWGYWAQFMKIITLFLFIVLVLRSKMHIDTFVWAIVLSISSYAAMEGVKFILSAGGHRIVGRAGIIADRNDLAVAINMCIPLIIYLIHVTRHYWLRLGLWGLLGLNVVAVVGTYSRGGFIGLSILAIAMWMNSRYKLGLAVLALLMLPVVYQAAPDGWKERQNTILTAAEADGSFIGRLWAWKISTLIALDNPLTGGGFGAVTDPVLWNDYAPETPDFGPLYTVPIPTGLAPKAAHNVYFQVLGDHGFLGLGMFLAILGYAYLNNRRNMKFGYREGHVWYAKVSSALNLSLIGFGITAANVSLAYFDLLYAVFGLVSVMWMYRAELVGRKPPEALLAEARVQYA
ncbi:putative O-glycosylation ligase, exosortase A system-associated [Chromatocurvus halotolerans]|uniref:Putative O-glycosylation ligase (Exosortase A-associated) n=1 Tax=Chromatocurvus halotolerans TaxID=1132028 RepID=A0A4R2KKW5_9GAMM|nr:putative O-glycosylation ligase, exosortase A system-associated [Chromatocurvus halotolerans]TCO74313.1 putative O-glycosylation ligase (exosortase A-associated) [Chromatocurvus halotolerans]